MAIPTTTTGTKMFVLCHICTECIPSTWKRKVVMFPFSSPTAASKQNPNWTLLNFSGLRRGRETAQTCLKSRARHTDWIWVNRASDAGNHPNTVSAPVQVEKKRQKKTGGIGAGLSERILYLQPVCDNKPMNSVSGSAISRAPRWHEITGRERQGQQL